MLWSDCVEIDGGLLTLLLHQARTARAWTGEDLLPVVGVLRREDDAVEVRLG